MAIHLRPHRRYLFGWSSAGIWNSRERYGHKNHSLLDVGWQEPEGHLIWQNGMPGPRGCGSKIVWRRGGLHLDGVQGEVEDSTLLWSEAPGFLSRHVVLEPQRKQQHQDSLWLSSKSFPHLSATATCSSPSPLLQSSKLKFPCFQATPSLRRTPHIQSTLSLERWLSSLAAVKINWVPWAESESVKSRELQTQSGSVEQV